MKVSTAAVVVSVAGALTVAGAWVLVRAGWASVWSAMGSILGILGILALASERVPASGKLSVTTALVTGAIAGLALYAGTHVFMRTSRSETLGRDADTLYAQRDDHTIGRALFVALVVAVPGEELFWRGFVQGTASEVAGSVGGALLAWLGYVGANLVSGSVPIVLGAIVGGLVWSALALWTGGILASVACHAVWTGLMIVRRPG